MELQAAVAVVNNVVDDEYVKDEGDVVALEGLYKVNVVK